MGRKKKSNFLVSAHRTLRKKSVVAAVYIVLRLLVILVMVAQFFNGNFENVVYTDADSLSAAHHF